MNVLKVLFCLLAMVSAGVCNAGLSAISPSLVAENEARAIASLVFQTGCAVPDLSDSNIDGKAELEISFGQDGVPLGANIISSNGSDSDNAKIIEALTKRCKYSLSPVSLPLGVVKQFTYLWKAHQDSSGIRACRIFNPGYPAASLRLKEEGKVVVSYRYLAEGGYESRVSQSSGFARLDDATLRVFNRCLDNRAFKGGPDSEKWLEIGMLWRVTGNENSSSGTQHSSLSSSASVQN